jgi:hypothetical protein
MMPFEQEAMIQFRMEQHRSISASLENSSKAARPVWWEFKLRWFRFRNRHTVGIPQEAVQRASLHLRRLLSGTR